MFIRKSRLADVLGEMRERAAQKAYVRPEAQGGYRLAIENFETLLRVKGRRRGLRQVQKGGDGSVQIQAGRTVTMGERFDRGEVSYDPALDWPDRYPDGGR